jgi:RND family efflux transporter MFP subunit
MIRSVSLVLGVVAALAPPVGAIGAQQDPGVGQAPRPGRPGSRTDGESGPRKVETITIRRRHVEWTTTQPFSVHASEFANLAAKVSGYLGKQVVDIGDRVSKGQVLVEIDAPEVVKAVDRARAELAQAEAQAKLAKTGIDSARANRQVAEAAVTRTEAELQKLAYDRAYRDKEYNRVAALYQRQAIDQKLVDEEENRRGAAYAAESAGKAVVATARAQVAAATAQVDQASAAAEAAQANVAVAREKLAEAGVLAGYTKVTAPFDGVITHRAYHVGDFVRAAVIGGGGEPILTIARTDKMRLVTQVPDAELPLLDRGDPAIIEVAGLGLRIEATVSRTAEVEDPATHAMRAEIDLPTPGGRLRAGMFGTVTITLVPPGEAIVIPTSAIVVADGVGYCLRVEGGRAVRTRVKVGAAARRRAEVLDGVREGDVVVLDAAGIADGQPVEPAPERERGREPSAAP